MKSRIWKPTIWKPLALGTICGLLAAITLITDLSFITTGITENAIGFYGTLFLLAAALGGPLAGVIAAALLLIVGALYGPPQMKAIITVPVIFWSNLIGLGITLAPVGLAYRWVFERVPMPARLLAWAGIVTAFYLLTIPASTVPQYLLLGEATADIVPAVTYGYRSYVPQALFDIVVTSLIFVALPAAYTRPLWYEPRTSRRKSDAMLEEAA
jgi:hypothetical protein